MLSSGKEPVVFLLNRFFSYVVVLTIVNLYIYFRDGFELQWHGDVVVFPF